MIHKIVQKIDNLQSELILWDDFLRFLESEGKIREIINDMRISQPGTTRLQLIRKFRVSSKNEEKRKQATGLITSINNNRDLEEKGMGGLGGGKNNIQFEWLEFIDLMDQDYLVTVSETKDVEIYDFQEMIPIYKFAFPSTYGKPGRKLRVSTETPGAQGSRFVKNFMLESSRSGLDLDQGEDNESDTTMISSQIGA